MLFEDLYPHLLLRSINLKQAYIYLTAMVKGRRVQVTLSAELERKLILWAYTSDERLPNWIKTVLKLQVDANWPTVQTSLKEKAERLKLPLEELEAKILEQAGFDFDRERRELEEGMDD